jgi:hypothetical protein
MRASISHALLLFGLLVIPSGCRTPMNEQADAAEPGQQHAYRLGDAPSWNKDVEDPWGEVGEMTRQARPVEKEVDPWYRNLFMSAEARNVERSLGIVDP